MKKVQEDQLWIKEIGNKHYRIGLTNKGQDDFGDIMFVEMPLETKNITPENMLIGVEAAKAVTEIMMPFSADELVINPNLEDDPELLNNPIEEEAWIAEATGVVL